MSDNLCLNHVFTAFLNRVAVSVGYSLVSAIERNSRVENSAKLALLVLSNSYSLATER